jgi:hypothetical protein
MSTARKGISPQASGSLPPGLPGAPISDREKVARSITDALTRLDLMLGLLETLNEPLIPFPGDADLRNGCERAMTSILSSLAGMEPAGSSSVPPGREEKALKARLNAERLSLLIDRDQFSYLWSFIVRLLP